MSMESKRRRVSVFREVGLLDDKVSPLPPDYNLQNTGQERKLGHYCRVPSVERIEEEEDKEATWEDVDDSCHSSDEDEDVEETILVELPAVEHIGSTRFSQGILTRRTLLLGLALLLFHLTSSVGLSNTILPSASGTIMRAKGVRRSSFSLRKRDNSPTDACKRWSQQSAIVNGTLYLYGGRATTSANQDSNTWNNYFISLDLKKSWQISAPPLNGLPEPSGPPAVANGYLWHSYDALFLYGGEYSDTPPATPDPFSLWKYDVKSSSWSQHSNPMSSDGVNSESAGQSIQRAAEGAGFSVPALGMGWYFGGHLDTYTSPSWSIQTPRLYLKSFIEYTFPGYSNPGVNSLNNGQTAGSDGAWRNITNAGIQDQSGFTERADGLLIYIPGFSTSGILLSLAGGTNVTFTQMNEVDVYDIANSTWYRQATSGPTPEIRVNPCAVVAAAADGSSYQVYMFGGQNLIPYGQQIQYSDMWILSIPSFTWIQVNTSSQSTPYARAGHSCDIWDSQMVVVGGYIGQNISCEAPGIYVFNTSSLEWVNSFTALPGGGSSPSNPFSQQLSQRGSDKGSGLHGSYGYAVPKAVYDVIGGQEAGGATITAPAVQATAGPLATGKPITYTVTGPNGATITETAAASPNLRSGANIGAAVAGSVAGLLFIVALYLAFCAVLYRRQLSLYRQHMALASVDADGAYAHDAAMPASAGGQWSWRLAGAGGYYRHAAKESTEGSGRFSGGSQHTSENQNSDGAGMPGPGYPHGNEMDNYSYGQPGTGSQDDLLSGFEPSYWGVLLHPRRSLRVINR